MIHTPPCITGDVLASYLPRTMPVQKKIQSISLTADVRGAIMKKLPIGFSYHGEHRIAIPVSVYTQEESEPTIARIRDETKGYPHKRTVESYGARRAIGFDALQVLDSDGAEEVWRTFHIDHVDNLRLLTLREIERIFPGLDDEDYMTTPTEPPKGHIRNWNWWFRNFLVERDDSPYDMRVPESFYGENLQSEEKSI